MVYFFGRHAGLEIGIHSGVDVETLTVGRILPVIEQRRGVIRLRIPRSGVVVAIDR